MGNFVVVDQDNYVPGLPKELDTEDIVDRDTYLDPQEQIRLMMEAGQNLAEYRKAAYGTQEGDADVDPTMGVDFDIVDAQRAAEALAVRLENQQRVIDEAKAAAAKDSNVNGSPGSSEVQV
jgi:hypothetical protein